MQKLTLNHLIFKRDNFKLEANMVARQGESIAILGANGSGKTTFFDLISGFLHPHSGAISIGDQVVTSLSPSKRMLSYLLQDSLLFTHFNVMKNLKLGLSKSRPYQTPPHFLDEIIEAFSLTALLPSFPEQLSGGQKQRIALARSILAHQPLLLLDEPFTGIDMLEKQTIMAFLKSYMKRYAPLILFTSHHQDEIQTMASRIIQIQVDNHAGHAYISG